jgi:hypothetical protein
VSDEGARRSMNFASHIKVLHPLTGPKEGLKIRRGGGAQFIDLMVGWQFCVHICSAHAPKTTCNQSFEDFFDTLNTRPKQLFDQRHS